MKSEKEKLFMNIMPIYYVLCLQGCGGVGWGWGEHSKVK